jgi:threonine dehydrogenase-like Zn-dependent dehydrogenase
MKAVVLQEDLQFSTHYPLPTLSEKSALIRPTMVGICKTDLELIKGYMGFRGVLGHEFVGIVEECEDPDWVGRRVVGEINCSPRNNIIEDPRHQTGRSVLGILNHDGVMAERFCLPVENLLAVPDHLSDEKAVFTEPLAAAYQIHEQMGEIPPRVLVLGDGKLGALCTLALKDLGSEVTWVGKHPTKLQALSHLVKTQLHTEQSLDSYPLVVEATGSATGLERALLDVEPKGTIILKTTVAAPHQVNLSPIVINEIKLLGSRCGRFAPALEALASGRIDPSFLIEEIYPLDRALEGFEHAARPGAAKVLLSNR